MQTTFPVDVSIARLVEFHGLADALCRAELGRLPTHTDGDPVGEIIELLAMQGQTGEQIQAWLHATDEAVAFRGAGTPPETPISRSALPPVPSREDVCAAKCTLQGLDYNTVEFGAIPAWGLGVLSEASRRRAYQAHRTVGDTMVHIELTGSYREPNTLWPDLILNGKDWSDDLVGFKDRLREIIVAGFFPDVPLGGDGQSINDHPQRGDYNDPVGDTYGFQWLMQNFERVARAMRGDAGSACPDGEDLTRYILFRNGWDAVFYGWSRDQVIEFGKLFRSILPEGYLAIEHDMGHIPVGGGADDYRVGGAMQDYDVILGEYPNRLERTADTNPDTNPGAKIWMILGRMCRPWVRPPDMPPAGVTFVNGRDVWDPSPPYYLEQEGPRGRFIYKKYEYAEYDYSHGRCSKADVESDRAYLERMNPGGLVG